MDCIEFVLECKQKETGIQKLGLCSKFPIHHLKCARQWLGVSFWNRKGNLPIIGWCGWPLSLYHKGWHSNKQMYRLYLHADTYICLV